MPIITGVNSSLNPRVGEPFFIECAVEGTPAPNITWIKDGVQLKHNEVSVAINHIMHY